MDNFKPTYLYVKTHNKTGLKYFGKTTSNDPVSYKGSGVYWNRHIKINGDDITTEIIGYYDNPEDLQYAAEKFSKEYKIVKSKIWANLIEENGFIGGDTSHCFTKQSKKKISDRMKGTNNPMSKLSKDNVLEIYFSEESPEYLSKKFSISAGQIFGIKRKVYYSSITEHILEMPGVYKGKKRIRIPLTTDSIIDIFLKEETYSYFKEKYGASRIVVKNIKNRKSYKKVTENLKKPGCVKKYNLTNQDTVNIFHSSQSIKELSKIYGVHPETVRNIKKCITRKFFNDEY